MKVRPTRKVKRRYVIVDFLEGKPEKPIPWLVSKLRRTLGTWGYASADIKVEEKDEKIVVSVAREWADIVAAAIVLGKEGFIPVTKVAGTLRSARRKGFL